MVALKMKKTLYDKLIIVDIDITKSLRRYYLKQLQMYREGTFGVDYEEMVDGIKRYLRLKNDKLKYYGKYHE